jgi:hypothetical protein
VSFNYNIELNNYPLINSIRSRFNFDGITINFTSSISGDLSKNKFTKKENVFKNGYKNICFIQKDYYSSFYINSNSIGMISNSVFENSQTGGIIIIDSIITITSTIFRKNIISSSNILNYEFYPNLRFNIFMDGNSLVKVNDIETDTPGSYWIHNTGTSILEGDSNIISSPLFTPIINVAAGVLNESFVTVNILGRMLYACNIVGNFIINDDWSSAQNNGFDVIELNENHSTINIPIELLKKTGEYYIYLCYGVNNSLNTELLLFYNVKEGSNEKGDNNLDEKGRNTGVIITLIIIIVIIIVGIIISIIFIVIYQKRQKKRRSNNGSESELKSKGTMVDGDSPRKQKYERKFRGGFGEEEVRKETIEEFDQDYGKDQENELLQDYEEDCFFFFYYFYFYEYDMIVELQRKNTVHKNALDEFDGTADY